MKFNSQICTTKEQSERLLALGLKKETADMRYQILYLDLGGVLKECTPSLEPYPPLNNDRFIPAWSLHRLIEMIHDEIVTYEVAKLAKEKGFNVPTRTVKVEKIEGTEKEVWDEEECRYITQWETRSVRIPTQSLLQRWLREEKNIHISVEYEWVSEIAQWIFNVRIKKIKNEVVIDKMAMSCYSTYELALENALEYVLEYVLEKLV